MSCEVLPCAHGLCGYLASCASGRRRVRGKGCIHLNDRTTDRYTEARSAPEAGKSSIYWSSGTRLQLELP